MAGFGLYPPQVDFGRLFYVSTEITIVKPHKNTDCHYSKTKNGTDVDEVCWHGCHENYDKTNSKLTAGPQLYT
jgi:hypothetical protein